MIDLLLSYCCFIIACAICFFVGIDRLIKGIGVPDAALQKINSSISNGNENAEKLTKYNTWKWRNRLLSLVHSSITGVWALACFYHDPKMAQDLITRHSLFSVTLVSFSIGYFIHDIYHICIGERSRHAKEMVLHHAVVTIAFGTSVYCQLYFGYSVVALIVEVNSVFLHIRQILQMLGYSRGDLTYRVVSLLNIGTFIIFRITTLTWMTRWLVINRDKVPIGAYTVGSVGMAITTLINIVLLYRLISSDFLKNSKSELKKSN